MDEHRSFIIELAALIDRYWRKSESSSGAYSQPGRLRRLIGWLTPNGGTLILIALLIATQSIWARPFAATNAPGPSATTVNYQGRLADNLGTPLDGSYGMSFALYDAATDGNLMWGPEVHDAVPVSDGLFSVGLGSRTTGGIPTTTWNGDRYLEITVGGETLSPRELIRSVPIAGMALTVPDGAIGSNQIADGAISSDKLAMSAIPILTASTSEEYWTLPQCDGTYQVIPGLSIDIEIDDQKTLFVDFTGVGRNLATKGNVYTAVYVNGSSVKTAAGMTAIGGCRNSSTDSGAWCTLANSVAKELDPGNHTVEIRVQCDSGEAVIYTGWMNAFLFP